MQTMQWGAQQETALDRVGKWYKSGSDQQIYRLFGYAGSGKTTLAKHLAESAGNVLFATFTGKAAHVLRQKGCPAGTIHSLIYQPRERGTMRIDDLKHQLDELVDSLRHEYHAEYANDPDGAAKIEARLANNENVKRLRREIMDEQKANSKPLFQLKDESLLREADLLVLDEVSMVGEDMAHDLMSFGTKILALGDPAQLPPVKGSGYFTDTKPDMLLTEIHRQARDNPIIDLATRVRNKERLEQGEYGESSVIDWADIEPSIAQAADQILVGTNKLRRGTNRRMRELLGHGTDPFPVMGDKIVCLRNNHDKGLLNGSLWEVTEAHAPVANRLVLSVKPKDDVGAPGEHVVHEAYFRGEEPPYFEIKEAECFDYGYALTTHKAQGSQWDNVLIFDESRCFRQDAHRWMYTAITRAAEKVTVVQR